MISSANKKFIAAAILFFTLSVAAGIFWGGRFMSLPERKPVAVFRTPVDYFKPKVSSETILIKDKEYLCGDLERISEEIVTEDLRGMDRETLVERFPEAEGWAVNFTDPRFLTLTAKIDEFCPIHRTYRHLGLYHGLVAVYEGPLGFNGKVIRVENITMESLNPEFKVELEQAMDFEKQSHTAAEKLREELEFVNDEVLNAALENLDEQS